MKTATVLFGLVVATGVAHADRAPAKPAPTPALRALFQRMAAPGIQIARTVSQPPVQRPRVDANGDMACGNVMSKSADDTCTARIAARQPKQPVAVARPLVTKDGEIATGNVMKVMKK
jgi:hypothetical protein